MATHAVLASASTAFQDLGLAVVDEEQRFGVEQRDKLTGECGPGRAVLCVCVCVRACVCDIDFLRFSVIFQVPGTYPVTYLLYIFCDGDCCVCGLP